MAASSDDQTKDALESIRWAPARFCSIPDSRAETHAICLHLEERGLLVRIRETRSGVIEWQRVDDGSRCESP